MPDRTATDIIAHLQAEQIERAFGLQPGAPVDEINAAALRLDTYFKDQPAVREALALAKTTILAEGPCRKGRTPCTMRVIQAGSAFPRRCSQPAAQRGRPPLFGPCPL